MKKKLCIDIILNIIIVLSVSIGMSFHIAIGQIALGQNPGLDGEGFSSLCYFTNLSNVFYAIVALIIVMAEVRMLVKKEERRLPRWLMILRQMATVGVAVTFMTVAFIFFPILCFSKSFPEIMSTLYSGQKVMTHFTTPVLAMVSLIFFANGESLNWKQGFFSMIPEFVYGIVYEILVPILGVWKDFYGFTLGGKWYAPFIVIPTICGIAYLCSFLLSLAHDKVYSSGKN